MALNPRRKKSRGWWKALLLFVLVLVALRAALPVVIEIGVERRLEAMDGYTGSVEDIDVNLWRGAYEVEGLQVFKTGGKIPVPLFSARKIDISVQWSELFRGAAVGEASLYQPEVNFVDSDTKEEEQKAPPRDWRDVVDSMFPMRLNQVDVIDGSMHFRNFSSSPEVDLYLKEIYAQANNLANTRKLALDKPATLNAVASAMEGGRLRLGLELDPFADQPTFDLDAGLKGVALVQLNSFLRHYANVDAEGGSFEVYVEASAQDGAYEGYVKPFLEDAQVFRWKEIEEKGVLQGLWEGLVGAAGELLESDKEAVAAKVPIRGSFEDPKTDTWSAIGSVLHNGFVRALVPRLEGSISGGGSP